MLEMDDDDSRPPIRLPNELLLFVANSLDDRDCVALSLSRAFEGFASLYDAERKEAAISIGYRHHFLSNPSHWTSFLSQNSCFPPSITVFDVNNCYWLPAQQICDAVVQLGNLEELNVNGTKVSLPNLAQVFANCQKITKLDFKFVEKSWEQVLSLVGKGNKMDIVIEKFKKLTSLKVSTWWLNPRDYLNDPWVLIIRILSWCRACIALTVEITYMGDDEEFKRKNKYLCPFESQVDRFLKKEFYPNLEWMTNLKKLVLIKYGTYSEPHAVRSLILDDLCAFLFTDKRAPSSIESIWVEDFHLITSPFSYWQKSPVKKSYMESDHRDILFDLSEPDNYQMALNDESIEHLGCIEELPSLNQRGAQPRPYLPKLKHFRAFAYNEENQQRLNDFIRDHPNLEQMFINCDYDYVPRVDLKLLKLTTLSVEWSSIIISQERMDILANLCPNIQTLRLLLHRPNENNEDIQDIPPVASLSSVGFKNLTSLRLYGQCQLHDGAFLISVIKENPKLRSLQLSGTFELDSFLPNFEQFLSLAVELRDLRLELSFNHSDSLIVLFLKSILKCCPHLERLTLIHDFERSANDDSSYDTPHVSEDFLPQFVTEMSRLIFCCIMFHRIYDHQIERINLLIEEKVIPHRPSLWFYVGDIFHTTPEEDPNMPLNHYLEMFDSAYYFPPPTS